MKHKTPAIVFLVMSVVLLCVALAVGLYLWGGFSAGGTDLPDETPPAAEEEQPSDGGEQVPAPDGEDGETDGQEQPEADGGPTPDPNWDGPLVSEQDGVMGPAYFADAAFLGNEFTSGLWLYNNDGLLPSDTSHWYCSDELTILGASPYAAQMPADTFGKVYIGFGLHEVNYQKQTVQAAYETVIDQVRESQPNAIIYLMSITPVSKYCDENLSYTRRAVQAFNQMLQQIARDQQVWYLDEYTALCGEDGYLPSDVTPDGTSFSPAHYQKWLAYMTTHYVPDGTPPVATAEPEPTEEPAATAPGQ